MIKINKEDFNRDLDGYISSKRGSEPSKKFLGNISKLNFSKPDSEPKKSGGLKLFSFFKRRIPNEEEIEARAYAKKVQQEKIEVMEEEIQEIHDEDEELEEKREGLLKRFLKAMRKSNKDSDEVIEEEEILEAAAKQQLNKDLEQYKDTFKMIHKWLEQLSPEKLNQFKRSEDFVKYKETLKKVGLIKE